MITPEPEDVRRRALELPGGVGVREAAARRQRRQGAGVRRRALQERAGARLRRPRRDDDLRRSAASATCCWRGRTRPTWRWRKRRARSRSSRRRSASWPSRRSPWSTRSWTSKGRRAVAEAYLQFLYSPEGQEIAAKNHYRPRDAQVLAKYAARVRRRGAVHHRRGVRRLAGGAEDALRRRRHVRPDLHAWQVGGSWQPAGGFSTGLDRIEFKANEAVGPAGLRADAGVHALLPVPDRPGAAADAAGAGGVGAVGDVLGDDHRSARRRLVPSEHRRVAGRGDASTRCSG